MYGTAQDWAINLTHDEYWLVESLFFDSSNNFVKEVRSITSHPHHSWYRIHAASYESYMALEAVLKDLL